MRRLSEAGIDEIVNGPKARRFRVKFKKAKRKPKVIITDSVRSCRMDIRLTIAEKDKLQAKAAKTRRTVTSVITELIEKMR